MSPADNGLILCVDDEPVVLQALRDQLLRAYGKQYIIEIAESAEEGLEILDELFQEGLVPLIIISDWLMPGMKGDDFFIEAHKRFPYVIKVMLTGHANEEAVQRAKKKGDMFDLITKPWEIKDLLHSIDEGLKEYKKRLTGNDNEA
ncbi:response regulator [Desulfogranum japonicum]|uniref:response regulator n=1 Tax=Desulfogranum japonicum TaxID=231447 RepID=UPI0003F8E55D|nr:response regulator [Desulfogranum japonicum]